MVSGRNQQALATAAPSLLLTIASNVPNRDEQIPTAEIGQLWYGEGMFIEITEGLIALKSCTSATSTYFKGDEEDRVIQLVAALSQMVVRTQRTYGPQAFLSPAAG